MMEEKVNDLLTDISEVFIDSYFDTGNKIIEELPIIKTINTLIQFKNSLDESIFKKKILNFLHSLKDVPVSKKSIMIKRIDDSKIYKQRVGEKLLEILNRIESDSKPEILGNLFKSFVEEKIDYNSFLILSYLLEKCFVLDLKIIAKHDNQGYLFEEQAKFLLTDDFRSNIYGDYENGTPSGVTARIRDITMDLVKYGEIK